MADPKNSNGSDDDYATDEELRFALDLAGFDPEKVLDEDNEDDK